MTEHIVTAFDTDLANLRDRVSELAEVSGRMVKLSVKSLIKNDQKLADEVIQMEDLTDDMHAALEDKAIAIIARRQPMAVDLRAIISAMRVGDALEKVADLAKNIGLRVKEGALTQIAPSTITSLEVMGERVFEHFEDATECFEDTDSDAAITVWRGDKAIDSLYSSFFRELLTYMMQDPRSIGECMQLLFSAKDLERIADHATDIAETVHFLGTGESIHISLQNKGEV